jgi:hypothetical protein
MYCLDLSRPLFKEEIGYENPCYQECHLGFDLDKPWRIYSHTCAHRRYRTRYQQWKTQG